ncbi:PHP domain-containing protein [Prochlorococcus sp. MIT 1223]|uniref:PHP domain-containing protein n=1 Tax=Prochlorococcus sp. MIT 1223 TaxID=3096217 RepID=UPI002A750695|nr:PHP domain-containing protein [Prochlorococcus sp. MIT 1223]
MDNNHPLIPILKGVSIDSCPYKLNFHTHTKYSDGSLDPIELYEKANKNGLKHLAITDHHNFEAYKDINNYLKEITNKSFFKTKIWSGIEITGLLNGVMVHILALGFDPYNPILEKYSRGDAPKGEDLKAENILKSISLANGLSILAHPARYKIHYEKIIEFAYLIGFDGVEVWYDYERNNIWSPSNFVCGKIKIQVDRYKMLSSCGTDTHGISLLRR